MEQLRAAKKAASRIAKAKAVISNTRSGSGNLDEVDQEFQDVPEWIVQQLPDLLRLLEASRLLVHVSAVGASLHYRKLSETM